MEEKSRFLEMGQFKKKLPAFRQAALGVSVANLLIERHFSW